MKCPACDCNLILYPAGPITVDVCATGCGGIWFDAFELKKVDELHESVTEGLLSLTQDDDVTVDRQKKRFCPKCARVAMMRHFFSAQRKVVVDECPNCGGFWLDAGELADIREETQLEKARRQAKENKLHQLTLEALSKELVAPSAEAPAESRFARRLKFMKMTARGFDSP